MKNGKKFSEVTYHWLNGNTTTLRDKCDKTISAVIYTAANNSAIKLICWNRSVKPETGIGVKLS